MLNLIHQIVNMKRTLEYGWYIHIMLPGEHGTYITSNDKVIPYWEQNYIVIERADERTIIPIKKIIMVKLTNKEAMLI